MKQINQFITEYIIKKKLDKPIDSEYIYHPQSKKELIDNINELVEKNIYDFNCINTSAITDMSSLFYDSKFEKTNIDVSEWDVSNVINMSGLFYRCTNFNCNLSNWNVSNVTDMTYMFEGCVDFKGKGLKNWDVGNVTNMKYMFYNCENFNCDLSNWNVSNVKNMERMFFGCDNFDNNLSKWNVSNVTNMEKMFFGCRKFKGVGLSSWDVSNVENMCRMFAQSTFNSDISKRNSIFS